MKLEAKSIDREAFISGYIQCALWTATDDEGKPLGEKHDSKRLAYETLAQMRKDCEDFIDENEELLCVSGIGPKCAGMDFWLGRNSKSGFRDEGHGDCFSTLAENSKTRGKYKLHLAEDGKICGS